MLKNPLAQSMLALLPCLLALILWPWVPHPLSATPGLFFYVPVIVCSVMGGLVPGLTSTMLCSLYHVLVIRPQIWSWPMTDPVSVIRLVMFAGTSVFFNYLIADLIRSRKRSESYLQRLQLALAGARMGTWEWDFENRSIEVDSTVQHSLHLPAERSHYSPQELGKALRFFQARALKRAVISALKGGSEFALEFRTGGPQRTERWFFCSGKPLRDKKGKVKYLLGTLMDVTSRKRLEEELWQAIELRNDFITMASHELKTPLTSLKLQVDLYMKHLQKMRPGPAADVKGEKLLAVSRKQIKRLSLLVETLLDANEMTSGHFSLNKGPCNFSLLVQGILERHGHQDPQEGHKNPLVLSHIPEQIMANCDPSRMEQVFENLLSNAIKYGEGRSIHVALRAEGGLVHLSVRDQGRGVKEEDRLRIFNKFERAVEGTAPSGLGLGLYICKVITEAHQGQIWVESGGRQGSTFHVSFPQ